MNRQKNYRYRIKPAYAVGTLQETLTEDLEIEGAISKLIELKEEVSKELAEELHAISLGLKGKIYSRRLKNRLENILGPILDKTKSNTINAGRYLAVCFAPTPARVWSSLLSGVAAGEFVGRLDINNFYSIYAGLSTAVISYTAQSIPLTKKERDNTRQKISDSKYSDLKE